MYTAVLIGAVCAMLGLHRVEDAAQIAFATAFRILSGAAPNMELTQRAGR